MKDDGSHPDQPDATDPFSAPSPAPETPSAFVPLPDPDQDPSPNNDLLPARAPILKARLIRAERAPTEQSPAEQSPLSQSPAGQDPFGPNPGRPDPTGQDPFSQNPETQRPLWQEAIPPESRPDLTPGAEQSPQAGPAADQAKLSLATLEFINDRCQSAPFMTYLLLAAVIMTFCYGLMDKPLGASYFWKAMLSDHGLHHDELQNMGGLYDGMLNPWYEYPRFFLSLFLHSGPWSLIFTLSVLFSAGRYVERLAGAGQAIFIFLMTGFLGNYVTMSVVEEYHALLFFPVGAWSGCFGLLAAQGGLKSRGILSDFPQAPSRGIFGSLILVWILGTLQFFPNAFNPVALAPIGAGLISAVIAGAILVRLLPAWADDPEAPGCISLLLAFLSMFILMVALVIWVTDPGSNPELTDPTDYTRLNPDPIKRKAAILKNLRSIDDDKLKFSIQVPKNWKVLRKGDSFRTYGTESFGFKSEYIYLNIRDRHDYDAPDTLIGRFLNMMVTDWNLDRNDVTIVFDEPFEHPTGKAHVAVFRIQRGSSSVRPGLQRCYYVILKDRVILALFFRPVKNDEGETAESIIRSLKLIKKDAQ